MNWRAIVAIIRKDLMVVTQSKAVMLPMIILPLVLVVVLPVAAGIGFGFVDAAGATSSSDVQELLALMPPLLQQQMAGYSELQMALVFALRYFFAPLFLILPLMTSSVIAADSFAGEKERKTLEALLYTPTTDRELLVAKLLGAWIPGIVVSFGSFVVYCLVANLVAWPYMHTLIMPDVMWMILALWVAPAAAGLGLGGTVLASTRVNSFQDAYQLGGLVVLPVLALMFGQISGVLFLSAAMMVLIGLVLWLLDAALLVMGERSFRRSELLARL